MGVGARGRWRQGARLDGELAALGVAQGEAIARAPRRGGTAPRLHARGHGLSVEVEQRVHVFLGLGLVRGRSAGRRGHAV